MVDLLAKQAKSNCEERGGEETRGGGEGEVEGRRRAIAHAHSTLFHQRATSTLDEGECGSRLLVHVIRIHTHKTG